MLKLNLLPCLQDNEQQVAASSFSAEQRCVIIQSLNMLSDDGNHAFIMNSNHIKIS